MFDHPKANRVIKLTHGDELGYGDFVYSYDAIDYIRSLFLGNALLGMDTRFEGIVRLDASLLQIVTSQTRVEFAKEGSKQQIAREMKSRGFYFDTAWWIHPIGAKISNAVPDNVLVDSEGRSHFIDVYIQNTRPILEILGDLAA